MKEHNHPTELPANERLPQERRPRQLAPREPDNLSIQLHIPLTGRRALVRNTIIGGNLALLAATWAATAVDNGIIAALFSLGGGVVIGCLVSLSALMGQRMARWFGSPDYAEMAWRTNWSAVLYAGVFAGQMAVLGLAVALITTSITLFATAFFTALISTAIGGVVGGGLTALLGVGRRWLRRGDVPPEERMTISIS